MKVSRWMTGSALLAVLLALSLYGYYSFNRMPSTRSKNNVDLRYEQKADYSYIALVKPSLLYDNRTEITEGEPLYTKLVERLSITLQYELTQDPNPVEMTDPKLKYEASATLSGGDWVKTYHLGSRSPRPTNFSETYTLNLTEIEDIVDTIGEETGTHIYAYTYEIAPQIHLMASAGGETIDTEFAPSLTISFEGGKIVFEGIRNTKTGTVTHRETEPKTWSFFGWPMEVRSLRRASIVASISTFTLLAVSVRFTLQERASRPILERLSGEIRDKIIEASEPPERIERATIKVGSLEDLAKISEETFKPIIHHYDVFHVLDGDVRYEYKMEAEADVEEE